MQKNHDHKLNHPYRSEDKYLVQVRHPIPRLISNFRLYCRRNPDQASRQGFEEFAKNQKDYYVKFWEKWVGPSASNIAVMRYENLTSTTTEEIARTLNFFQPGIADLTALAEAAEHESEYESVKKTAYKAKSVEDFEFYDADFAAAYTEDIATKCRGFDYPIK